MYYPYFRGKQYELITIRENAELLSKANFVPIVEPVKTSLSPLIKTIDSVLETQKGEIILIENPTLGDHKNDATVIREFYNKRYSEEDRVLPGIMLTEGMGVSDALRYATPYIDTEFAFIHMGFTEASSLSESLKSLKGESDLKRIRNVFHDDYCGILYRRHFSGQFRVLLSDGYKTGRTNKEHPEVELFSDLHITYVDRNMDGFGDFLIVGDQYSETGGPAYAVAIHITFIDSDKDNQMYIYHFISDTTDTPTDPKGKFSEALNKLVKAVNSKGSKIIRTKAIEEFLTLHKNGHYPGLGYVKKLSMQHHLETLAQFFRR